MSRVRIPPKVTAISPADRLLQRFNQLNKNIALMVPAVAVAQDTIARVTPMLREMQALLSRKPNRLSVEYKMLERQGGRILGARLIEDRASLPPWGVWIAAFALEVGYSVRQLRRYILNEPRRKSVKQCGWTRSAHEQVLEIALQARQLVRAMADGTGGETYRIAAQLEQRLDASQELLKDDWEVDVEVRRKRKSHKATRVEAA
jgi:hypothetical protein